jgi:hypothetical protein
MLDLLAARCHSTAMTFSQDLKIPNADFLLELIAGKTTIFVGANGSGKTRLASWLEEQGGVDAHRISAHRALTLNPGVIKVSESQSKFRLLTGIDTPDISQFNNQKDQIPNFVKVIGGHLTPQRTC